MNQMLLHQGMGHRFPHAHNRCRHPRLDSMALSTLLSKVRFQGARV